MLSNTDMETLWAEGRIDPAIFDRAAGNFPTSILDIKTGESFIYEDKIQIISAVRSSGDIMFALTSNLTPDTEYYYSSALLVAGESVSVVFGEKKTFRTLGAGGNTDTDTDPVDTKKADLFGIWRNDYTRSMEYFGFPYLTYEGNSTVVIYQDDSFSMNGGGYVRCSGPDEVERVSNALLKKGFVSTSSSNQVAFKWDSASFEGIYVYNEESQTLTVTPYYDKTINFTYKAYIDKAGCLVLIDEDEVEVRYKKQ